MELIEGSTQYVPTNVLIMYLNPPFVVWRGQTDNGHDYDVLLQ